MIIITGGGTAGHTNPGIAVAEALTQSKYPANKILFVGGVRGNEKLLVEQAGFRFLGLKGRGIQRKLSKQNIISIFHLFVSTCIALKIVRKHRKNVSVLCLGGYASFPVSFAAVLLNAKLFITEQNTSASLVNKLLSVFAEQVFVPENCDLEGIPVGNPIRSNLTIPSPQNSFEVPLIVAWGGSLGASALNKTICQLTETNPDYNIYHITGTKDYNKYADRTKEGYQVVEYEHNMHELLNKATIAVCRSGASSVSELTCKGIPAVFIPLPNAPRNHQKLNALPLVESDASFVLSQQEVTVETLSEKISMILNNYDKMSANMRKLGKPEAANDIALYLLQSVGETQDS